MEEEKIEPVNCAAVVRAVKDAGHFMLLDRDGEHYIVTEYFMLHLRKRDAFRIQCKLEVEHRNVYYCRIKKKWVQANEAPHCDNVLERYQTWISQGRTGNELTPTGVAVVLYEDIPMDGRLYAGGDGYTLVRGDYLEMLGNTLELARTGDIITVNNCHVISVMQDDAWKDNSFIVQYKQEGEE